VWCTVLQKQTIGPIFFHDKFYQEDPSACIVMGLCKQNRTCRCVSTSTWGAISKICFDFSIGKYKKCTCINVQGLCEHTHHLLYVYSDVWFTCISSIPTTKKCGYQRAQCCISFTVILSLKYIKVN
jgi:hypothetical protein